MEIKDPRHRELASEIDNLRPVADPLLHLVGGVGEDRRGDHPEADREDSHVRGQVARLERRVGPFVGGREFPAAELLGALDPPEPGVEALGTPGLGLLGLDGLGFPVLLVEHGDVV